MAGDKPGFSDLTQTTSSGTEGSSGWRQSVKRAVPYETTDRALPLYARSSRTLLAASNASVTIMDYEFCASHGRELLVMANAATRCSFGWPSITHPCRSLHTGAMTAASTLLRTTTSSAASTTSRAGPRSRLLGVSTCLYTRVARSHRDPARTRC